ncbi:MAG: hypothetical protein JWQ26_265 [Modestobacter sp.]|nr:hypothetical protein [Modestobacter sp.]
MPSLTSLVGAATAAYSVSLVAAPRILIGPCGLDDTRDVRTLTRAIGVRDAAIGLAMMTAPPGPARRLLTAARVAADWGDAGAFGAGLAGRGTRGKVVGFAAAWGALSLLAGVLDERSGH